MLALSLLLALSVLAVFVAAKLMALGALKEKEKVASETAKITQAQAEKLGEHRTDADVVRSLRTKAAAKRQREKHGKR